MKERGELRRRERVPLTVRNLSHHIAIAVGE